MSFNLFIITVAYIISMFVAVPFDSNLVFSLLTGNYILLILINNVLNYEELF